MQRMGESRWDAYLRRASHLAQFGLFALTLSTLYFTVIPLYQKAILEEQIAQKEMALRDLERAVEENYRRVRTYTVREFVFRAGPPCSGLMLPLPAPGQRAQYRRDGLLELDVGHCLRTILKDSKDIVRLKREDSATLMEMVQDVILTAEVDREKVRREFDELPRRAAADPSILKPLTGYAARAPLHVLSPDRAAERRLKLQISQARSELIAAYGNRIRNSILSLNEIKWNDPELVKTRATASLPCSTDNP